MDMSGGSRITEMFVDPTHGYSYRYERIFTNASANANHDPFRAGLTAGVRERPRNSTNGWMTQSSANCDTHDRADRVVHDCGAELDAVDNPWPPGRAAAPLSAKPDKCTPSLSRTTVNNGTKLTLTITYSGSANSVLLVR